MKERQIVEEIIAYLVNEQLRLKRELTDTEKKYYKANITLQRLPQVPLWRNPLKPLLKRFLPNRLNRLDEKILRLKERIKKFAEAQANIEQGRYYSATPVLRELADTFALREMSILLKRGLKGSHYKKILELRKELIILLEQKEESPQAML